MRLERPLQIARMIVHPELAFDQGRDALEGPALAGKARRHRAPVQEPAQTSPGLLIEPRGPTRNRARFQTTRALLGEGGGAAADTGAADPKCPGNLGLRELSLAQQRRARETPLLHLPGCQMRWPPNVVIHRASPHEDRHRPMLHPLREDH